MGEEGIDNIGGRKKVIAAVLVAVVVIAAGIWAYRSGQEENNGGGIWGVSITLDTIDTDDAWIVKVVGVSPSYDDPEYYAYQMNESYVKYRLKYNRSEVSPYAFQSEESFFVSEIKEKQSPMGVSWVNVNNSGILEVGDYLVINKSGGIAGRASAHDLVFINCLIAGGGDDVYLPPAEFLEMGVVKTPTGWNMTVTWVNETVPRHFLEVSYINNISFRLENRSGELFTTADPNYASNPGYVFGLNFIDDDFTGDWNWNDMGFYNITWHDNDRNGGLSVNDTFIIDNYGDLIEPGFKFRLICEKYGWVHTIYEVTFE